MLADRHRLPGLDPARLARLPVPAHPRASPDDRRAALHDPVARALRDPAAVLGISFAERDQPDGRAHDLCGRDHGALGRGCARFGRSRHPPVGDWHSGSARGGASGAVEFPLAGPVMLAGLRVAAVSTISLVTVGILIGVQSLGYLFTNGFSGGSSPRCSPAWSCRAPRARDRPPAGAGRPLAHAVEPDGRQAQAGSGRHRCRAMGVR